MRRFDEHHSSNHMKHLAVARPFAAFVPACLLLAVLAGASPVFGQGVREQLISQFHQACMADAQGSLQHELHFVATAPIDTAKFCACADAAIQRDNRFDSIAALPEPDRPPSSRQATYLEQSYWLDGFDCYSESAGWPQSPASAAVASRTQEEFRLAVERRKGAMYAIYNRALKRNPVLTGKMVFELTIEPSGKASQVSILSSELDDAEMKRELTALFETMQLAARPVAKLVERYPVDFLPN
jgi:hypothetical protein